VRFLRLPPPVKYDFTGLRARFLPVCTRGGLGLLGISAKFIWRGPCFSFPISRMPSLQGARFSFPLVSACALVRTWRCVVYACDMRHLRPACARPYDFPHVSETPSCWDFLLPDLTPFPDCSSLKAFLEYHCSFSLAGVGWLPTFFSTVSDFPFR